MSVSQRNCDIEETDDEIFERIVQLRMRQCRSLETLSLQELVRILLGPSNSTAPEASSSFTLVDSIEKSFREQMKIAQSSDYPSKQRRMAFRKATGFLQALDQKMDESIMTSSLPNNNNDVSNPSILPTATYSPQQDQQQQQQELQQQQQQQRTITTACPPPQSQQQKQQQQQRPHQQQQQSTITTVRPPPQSQQEKQHQQVTTTTSRPPPQQQQQQRSTTTPVRPPQPPQKQRQRQQITSVPSLQSMAIGDPPLPKSSVTAPGPTTQSFVTAQPQKNSNSTTRKQPSSSSSSNLFSLFSRQQLDSLRYLLRVQRSQNNPQAATLERQLPVQPQQQHGDFKFPMPLQEELTAIQKMLQNQSYRKDDMANALAEQVRAYIAKHTQEQCHAQPSFPNGNIERTNRRNEHMKNGTVTGRIVIGEQKQAPPANSSFSTNRRDLDHNQWKNGLNGSLTGALPPEASNSSLRSEFQLPFSNYSTPVRGSVANSTDGTNTMRVNNLGAGSLREANQHSSAIAGVRANPVPTTTQPPEQSRPTEKSSTRQNQAPPSLPGRVSGNPPVSQRQASTVSTSLQHGSNNHDMATVAKTTTNTHTEAMVTGHSTTTETDAHQVDVRVAHSNGSRDTSSDGQIPVASRSMRHDEDPVVSHTSDDVISARKNASESSQVSDAVEQDYRDTEIKLTQSKSTQSKLTQVELARLLQSSLPLCKPYLRPYVAELAKRGNIARSRHKFLNYAVPCLRLNREAALEVWTHIETVQKAAIDKQQKSRLKDMGLHQENEGTSLHRSSPSAVAQPIKDTATRIASSASPPSVNGHPTICHSKQDMAHIAVPEKSRTGSTQSIEMRIMDDTPGTSYANAVITERPRGSVLVKFDNKPVSTAKLKEIGVRLYECDPFWEIVAYVDVFQTNPVDSSNYSTHLKTPPFAKTAFQASMDIKKAYMRQNKIVGKLDVKGNEWGLLRSNNYLAGETRLLFIMIPQNPGPAKRASGHCWPKGTFLQLSTMKRGKQETGRIRLDQRAQRSYDLSLWKGMCKILDLTQHIDEPNDPIKVEGITYDDDLYFGCVVYAKFRPPNVVYQILMDRTSPDSISFLTTEEAERKAISFASSEMVVIDSDDENEPGVEEAGKFIFSLTDASSMKLMTTPVRGIYCKHFQVSIRYHAQNACSVESSFTSHTYACTTVL